MQKLYETEVMKIIDWLISTEQEQPYSNDIKVHKLGKIICLQQKVSIQ